MGTSPVEEARRDKKLAKDPLLLAREIHPTMPGGGDAVSSRAQATGRRKRQTPPLPLDILLEIAARSDPATLVRCAATCRDMRCRAVDDDPATFRRRLRLQHTGRFILPLLRGHLTMTERRHEEFLVDTSVAAPDATRLTKLRFPPAPGAVPKETLEPLDSRGGLVLLAVSENTNPYYPQRHRLRVCNLVTRHSHTFPLGPPLSASSSSNNNSNSYVLLVGGDSEGCGQPSFRVLEAKLELSGHDRSARCLRIQTFSSEHGVWGPCTTIPTRSIEGGSNYTYELLLHAVSKPLVVGDVVHWLCLTGGGSYVLMLHVGAKPRAKVTTLPASFPRNYKDWNYSYTYLLATASAGGSPVVLVADNKKISAWPQSKGSKIWKQQPWTVIDFDSVTEVPRNSKSLPVKLECFAETSGVVLIRIYGRGFVWLDLQSKAIVWQFLDASRVKNLIVYCSYEMHLSSWVPNFSSSSTIL